MVFSGLEFHAVNAEVKLFVDSMRPPAYARSKLDIYYHIYNQTVEIGERRLVRRGEQEQMVSYPLARITFNRVQKAWRLYWWRGNIKWECHDAAYTISEVLEMALLQS